MGILVADGRFKLSRRLSRCNSSVVHRGTIVETGEEVAIKLEPTCTRRPQLLYEVKLYRALAGGTGIPRVHWAGTENNFNILVVDLLGPSLEKLFRHCDANFSTKTIAELVEQVVNRLEYMHAKGFIHRDVRPETFLIGRGPRVNQAHVVGLAMAKRYRPKSTGQDRVPCAGEHRAMWNLQFGSVNSHLGAEQGRRDDLESAGYMLVYFCRGMLPWQVPADVSRREVHAEVREKKLATSIEDLCEHCPPQFARYIAYCRGLRDEERPDYTFLRHLLRDCSPPLASPVYDFVSDWTVVVVKRRKNDKQLEGLSAELERAASV